MKLTDTTWQRVLIYCTEFWAYRLKDVESTDRNWNTPPINRLNAELNSICHLLVLLEVLTFMGPYILSIFQYISNKIQLYTVYLYLETALHISGGTSTHNQERIQLFYSIWYLSYRYCYLPLSWKSWNRFECAVGVTNTRCCKNVL
jgi:hypothetical protein